MKLSGWPQAADLIDFSLEGSRSLLSYRYQDRGWCLGSLEHLSPWEERETGDRGRREKVRGLYDDDDDDGNL